MGRSSTVEIGGGALQDAKASAVLTASQDVGSAVSENTVAGLPKCELWRVTKTQDVVMNGVKQKMYEGKEIDTLNYDLKLLRKQGIKLERVPEEEVEG